MLEIMLPSKNFKMAAYMWVIPRQLDQAMTPMVTDLFDYFVQLTSINTMLIL
jgi:hypothetical protein